MTTSNQRQELSDSPTAISSSRSETTRDLVHSSNIPSIMSTVSTIPPTSINTQQIICQNSTRIGLFCNISNTPCDVLKPCLNNGSCSNTNTTVHGYNCTCPTGFNGTNCDIDNRPCQSNTCRNKGNDFHLFLVFHLSLFFYEKGTCQELSNGTHLCHCAKGWEGIWCERRINYCKNITCQNRGLCRSILLDYRCECLGDSFSGRHCEIVARKIIFLRIFAKFVACIAIIIIISFFLFIFMMDGLKYIFGIDPVKEERVVKQKKKRRHPMIVHHVYVNAPVLEEQQ